MERDARAAEWELIRVAGGSNDDAAAYVASIADTEPRIRSVLLARNYGKASAMQAGFDVARNLSAWTETSKTTLVTFRF